MLPLPVSFTDIERSGPPATKNGAEWEVPLSGEPPPQWVRAFHNDPGEFSSVAIPQAVMGQPGRLIFRSSPDNVAQWIGYIDKWIARSNETYRRWLDQAQREAEQHQRAEEAEAERVRALNDRFKNL